METVADFIFLGSKITADGDCSHEIKRCLLLGRKVMTKLHSTLWVFPVAQLVKNLLAMLETLVQFPGWEDSLEKG